MVLTCSLLVSGLPTETEPRDSLAGCIYIGPTRPIHHLRSEQLLEPRWRAPLSAAKMGKAEARQRCAAAATQPGRGTRALPGHHLYSPVPGHVLRGEGKAEGRTGPPNTEPYPPTWAESPARPYPLQPRPSKKLACSQNRLSPLQASATPRFPSGQHMPQLARGEKTGTDGSLQSSAGEDWERGGEPFPLRQNGPRRQRSPIFRRGRPDPPPGAGTPESMPARWGRGAASRNLLVPSKRPHRAWG